jgi:hypothetical protein
VVKRKTTMSFIWNDISNYKILISPFDTTGIVNDIPSFVFNTGSCEFFPASVNVRVLAVEPFIVMVVSWLQVAG